MTSSCILQIFLWIAIQDQRSVVLSYDKVWDVFRWKQGIRSVFQRIQKIRTLPLSEKVRILLLWCTSRDSNPGPTDQESKPPVRLNLWKFRVIVIFNQSNVIFYPVISAPFVRFCNDLHPLHVLKPCKNRALTPRQTKIHFIRQRLDGIGLGGHSLIFSTCCITSRLESI